MKRHPALHPLSRDHHNVLVHARRLRGDDPRVPPGRARHAYLAYAHAVLLHHFDEEERLLLPLADASLAQQVRRDHRAISEATEALRLDPSGAAALGRLLREHVRFEEGMLFPALEREVGAEAWLAFTEAVRKQRAEARPLSLAGGEPCFL